MTISLRLQMKTVEREIAQRRKVYPRLVGARKMRQAEADMHIRDMQAVLDTLIWLNKHEDAIRGRVVSSGGEARS